MEKEKKQEKQREFSLSNLALSNKTSVIVLTFIILISGVTSYISMPKENFPEVITPEIYIGTAYPGNSPLDIEKLITRPIEKEVNSITGVDEILSTSIQGYSAIQVKFDFDITPTEALRKVKDKVDIAMSDPDFPDDLPADPNIFEMNFSELIPIMNINLSGEFSMDQLKEYAEYLEEEIEDLPEISKVDIRGVMEKEVKVDVNLFEMQARNVSFGDIAAAIANENITISGGDISSNRLKRSVRVIGEFKHASDIEDIIVKQENLETVYIRDIAEVSFGEEERESYAREYLAPVVMVDVIKRAGENLLVVSDEIRKIVKESQETVFPDNLVITVTNDQSDQTRTQVGELENSIIFGVILVVGVLLFFLGLRNALFVGVAIPLSMFLSFLILAAMGVTLNVMVLFSLVMALGMLVDNGIVVVENIYRLMDEGYPPLKAARNGVGEVAWPIIASTATTLAAFFPLALWPGLMGEFMKYLPITLIIVLSSSLFVALVINPVLTSIFMRVDEVKPNKKRGNRISLGFIVFGLLIVLLGATGFGNLVAAFGILGLVNMYLLTPGTKYFQTRIIPSLENHYEKFLKRSLSGSRPKWFLGGTVSLLFFSFILLGVFPPKVEFFPINEPQYLNVFIEMPIGTSIEETNELTKEVEATVIETLSKYDREDKETGEVDNLLVESVIGQVGEGTSDPNQGPSLGNTPNKARITVQFVKFQDREGIMTNDVLTEVREGISNHPGVKITVSKNEAGPPQGAPINIEITGDDYIQLLAEAQRVSTFIDEANIAGIEGLKLDVEQGKPEMPILVDRKKARRFSLSTAQIGDAMRTALFGKEVSTFKEGEDDYPVNIRLKEEQRNNPQILIDQPITFRDQTSGKLRQVPISAVADVDMTSTFSAVKRKDLDRVVTISSNVLVGYNPNEVVEAIKKRLEGYDLPKENDLKFTGQQEEQAKEMAFLSKALMIAVFLIFLIIVSQFNSASTPFIIIMSVILSLIGVLLGLVIFQMDFIIIMTMIGIISLAGVVVNNAIVLIDYTNLIINRRKEELGMEEHEMLSAEDVYECIVEGGKKRLRPVLLTAITTVLGLLPLAVGLNINFYSLFSNYDPQIYVGGDNVIFWGPMSWTIIFGLSFATFLTLVIVPVMYLLLKRFKLRLARFKQSKVAQTA